MRKRRSAHVVSASLRLFVSPPLSSNGAQPNNSPLLPERRFMLEALTDVATDRFTQPSTVQYTWRLLRAGPIRLDGGGMFGVVPRAVWSKALPPDDRNRVTVAHNCLLLERTVAGGAASGDTVRVLVEAGSGNKLDAKMKDIFGLTDRTVVDALNEVGVSADGIGHVIVTHLHFDHAGGLTRLARVDEMPDWTDPDTPAAADKPAPGVKLTFPKAKVIVQTKEWDDAQMNNSVMTRTYLRDHVEPLKKHVQTIRSPRVFPPGYKIRRNDRPANSVYERMNEVLPGICVFLVPGHTWGQQAVLFRDPKGQTVVFTPDVMPTIHHVGASYSLAYDVEPYTSMITRRWFLEEAVKGDWLLVLVHEPNRPTVRVREDGKGWFRLVPEG